MSGFNKAGKTITFSRAHQKLKDLDYRVDGLWFGTDPPDHYDDAFDVVASTHLILDQKATTLALCFDNLVIPWDAILLKKLSGDLSRFLGAQYGYVYQRRLIHGPWAFPYGTIAHGGSDKERISDEERERVGKWVRAQKNPLRKRAFSE